LPSLLVCFLCQTLSRRITIYIEQYDNRLQSPAHAGEFFVDILRNYRVQDLIGEVRKFVTLPEGMPFAKFKELLADSNQDYFPVVNCDNQLTGIFTSRDIRPILFTPEVDDLIIVKDIAVRRLITTNAQEDLGTVMTKFTKKNLDCIPVVDPQDPSSLLGMLRRREVIDFYNNKLAEIKAQGAGFEQ
jgi:CIC family chloride channel protein